MQPRVGLVPAPNAGLHDAAYLWLALAHQAPLVTFDRKLAAAHLKAAKASE